MNISGNIYDNHGHSQYVNLWAPDPPQPASQTPTTHRHLHGLAKAGVFGIIALAVIAIVAGILAILPKPLRVVVILAALGWVVWSVATLPKTENPAPVASQSNEVVSQPTTPVVPLVYDTATRTWIPDQAHKPAAREPEVRRATLVNPHPNH